MAKGMLISYNETDSYVHKLNPLTKLLVLVCAILLCFTVQSYTDSLILFALVLPMAFLAKIGWSVFSPVKTLYVIFILVFVIQGLFTPNKQTVLFSLPFGINVWTEGVLVAASVTSRLLVMIVYGFLFVQTTHPGDLVVALRKIKLPYKAGYIILTTLQLIPNLRMQIETIIEAQKSRGLDTSGNLITRIKGYIPLVGPLFMGSVQQAVERTMALEARAFSADTPKTSLRQTIMHKRDKNIMIGTIIVSIAIGVVSWVL